MIGFAVSTLALHNPFQNEDAPLVDTLAVVLPLIVKQLHNSRAKRQWITHSLGRMCARRDLCVCGRAVSRMSVCAKDREDSNQIAAGGSNLTPEITSEATP